MTPAPRKITTYTVQAWQILIPKDPKKPLTSHAVWGWVTKYVGVDKAKADSTLRIWKAKGRAQMTSVVTNAS